MVAVRWGRLAGSMTTPPGADPRPAVAMLRATAQVVERPRAWGATSVEETLLAGRIGCWRPEHGLVEVDSTDSTDRSDDTDHAGPGKRDDCAVLSWPIGAAPAPPGHQAALD